MDYINMIGRNVSEIKGIFLTHAHPDHIGCSAWFQEHTGCNIYASEREKRWIEEIDLQFMERPIPNFYQLAGKSSHVDVVVNDGDEIFLDDGTKVKVIRTAGHSCDEVSYIINDSMFIGDSVPVKGDIPIFIDEKEIRRTLDILKEQTNVKMYYPAWDQIYTIDMMKHKLSEAMELIDLLKSAVKSSDDGADLDKLVERVCEKLNMPMLKENPLFSKTLDCMR